MAGESIEFRFVGTGAGQLASGFRQVGDNAALAARGARLAADAIEKQRKAADASVGATLALARADKLLADAEAELARDAAEADVALRREGDAARKAGRDADQARGGFRSLVGEVTGFGAAADAANSKGNKFRLALAGLNLASGVLEPALAGVVVAAGGLAAGFAAAGAGLGAFGLVAKSVFTQAQQAAAKYAAAQAKYDTATTSKQRAAALQAEKNAMAGLSPPVRALAAELGTVQGEWKKFTDAAAPGVVGVIGKGLGLLPKILAAMKPFLAPVEKALSGIIGQLSRGLSSSGFKSFIDALAGNSGPAITKIATAIGNVAVGIGGILRAFLPVSQGLLSGLDKITAKFAKWGSTLSGHSGFTSLMATFKTETPQAVAILKNLGTVIGNVGKAMFGLSTFSNSRVLLAALTPLSGVLASLSRNTDLVRAALYALAAVKIGQQFTWIGPAWQGIVKFAAAAEGATVAQTIAAAATRAWGLAMDALPWVALAAAVVAVAVLVIKYHTQIWAFMKRAWHDILGWIMDAWNWVKTHWPLLLGILTGPIGLAVLAIVKYWDDIKNAARVTLDAIKGVWDTVWGAIKGAFRGFVNGILTILGDIISGAAKLFGWLPFGIGNDLKNAAKKFSQFRDEVNAALGGINNKTVSVQVLLNTGQAVPGITQGIPKGVKKAAGGLIAGGIPGRDSVLIAAMPGEVVVPTHMVRAGAVDHLRGRLPGFAGGGVVGVNAVTPGYQAVESQLMGSLMKLAAAFAKATQAIGGSVAGYKPGAGVAQWRGTVLRALSMAGSPADFANRVLYQMQTESGGNPYAVNKWDSNWRAGHPSVGLMQVIAGTYAKYGAPKMGYPAPVAYRVSEQPLANTYAAIKYAQAAYGPNLANRSGGIGSGKGYDRGGLLMPGLTLAYNGTGRPEMVLPAGPGGGRAEDRLIAELRALREEVRQLTGVAAAIPSRTGQHVAAGVNGAASDAAFRARYPSRGR